jgi:hypothetical protein
MKSRILRNIIMALTAVLFIVAAGFVIWAETPAPVLESAQQALQSDSSVKVVQDEWMVFEPLGVTPELGLILYPGGRVDPAAYASPARAIAEQGYRVVIVPMPLNLAVFGFNRALHVEDAFPEIDTWVVGGHSLGGAMAAHFAHDHPDDVAGLVLWGAFSAESDDLSDSNLAVLCVSGSRDGLSTPGDIATARPRLPADTVYLEIDGANHAQFGSYGPQRGDLDATISRSDQQQRVVQATLAFLDSLKSN